MKLYTEEQVSIAINAAKANPKQAYLILAMLRPIELPTYEEIEKELFYQKQVMNPYPTIEYAYTAYEKGFMDCANLIIDKIQGGNK